MSVQRDGRRFLAKVPGATSVPSPTVKKSIGVSHSSPVSLSRHVPASHLRHQRWTRRHHVDAYDVAVWIGFTAFCAAAIGIACAALWVLS